jgi:hypothetical protein
VVALAGLAVAAGCGGDDRRSAGAGPSAVTSPASSPSVSPSIASSGTDTTAGAPSTSTVDGTTAGASGGGGGRPLDGWERHVLDDDRPQRAIFIAGGDLDEDGDADVVTGSFWYENPGDVEGPWQRHDIGSPLSNMALVDDLDGDGHLDVLGTEGVGSTANADFAFARGDGSGRFDVVAPVVSAEGDFLQGVCAARFDPAGPLQIALSWHGPGRGIQLLTVPADPAADPWAWRQIETFSQDEALSCGDIDEDGDPDLLLGTRWLRNDGDGWSLEDVDDTEEAPDRNRLVDIDGDRRVDALVGFEAISVEGTLAWYQQPASTAEPWPEHVIADDVVGPMSVSAADLDGDGDTDVVVGEHDLARPDEARLLVYENTDGAGTSWQAHTVYQGDEHHDGAELVDIDGDGDLDVISIGWGHGRVVLYENLAR